MADDVTGISLRDVRKLIQEKPVDDSVLDAVDKLLDVAILLSPVVSGPVVGAALLVLIEPKNALVDLARGAIKKFAASRPGDYLDHSERLAAVNCLLTYTAHFDALQLRLPQLVKDVRLSDEDKKRMAEGRYVRRLVVEMAHSRRDLPSPFKYAKSVCSY